ncbi:MAG: hypothetical protein HBSIN02_16360 [Bacteroidia bacterium]|nr:MAG: hypothetical protein HBSIN02_16360 [Bacteroidia bacterium]
MRTHNLLICLAVFILGGWQLAFAQAARGERILARCEEAYAGIEDYTVDLAATINMERVQIPEMKATLYFKRPDRIHVKSGNFALLPRAGLAMPVTALTARYTAAFEATDSIEGKEVYRLILMARNPQAPVQSMTIWVDPSNHTIVQTTSSPYRGRSVTVKIRHALQEGRFWLPERMTAVFTTTLPDTIDEANDLFAAKPQLQEFRRPPRNGSMEIRYSNYRLNTGLSDELFKTNPE